MNFKGTPRDLAYTASKWLVIFIGALVVLYLGEALWFLRTVDDEWGSIEEWLLSLQFALVLYLPESAVFQALVSSIFGWMIAFVGIFLANGAPRFAAFVFAFAAFVTSLGLPNQYWYAAIPTVLALGYLSLWAWSLRNQIEIVDSNPVVAENLAQERTALKQREMIQEDVITRR